MLSMKTKDEKIRNKKAKMCTTATSRILYIDYG
jgi:hypothetical protein